MNDRSISKNGGFALLFSVLVMSIVLSIIFSIANISYKQAQLSGIGKDSQIAFYAADSGAECAQYWDNKHDAFATSSSAGYVITCNGQSFTVGGELNPAVTCPTGSGSCIPSYITYNIDPTQSRPSQAVTVVYKNIATGETTVSSSGKNTNVNTDPRQVERSVKLTYTPNGSLCTSNGDILVLQDLSGSISSYIPALTNDDLYLVDQLYQSPSNIEVGFIPFGSTPAMETRSHNGSTIVSTGLTPHTNEQTLLYGPDQDPNHPDYGSVASSSNYINGGYSNLQAALMVAGDEFSGSKDTVPAVQGIFDSEMNGDNMSGWGDLATSHQVLVTADNRDDTVHPNYIVMITDGGIDMYVDSSGQYQTSFNGSDPNSPGGLPLINMQNLEAVATQLKNNNVKIVVISADTGDSDFCKTDGTNSFVQGANPKNIYPKSCDNFLARMISSGDAYFYKSTGYDPNTGGDMPNIIKKLTKCS